VLLDRARKALGGGARELPPAESYDITCLCGQHVTGWRHDYRQFVACSVCGQFHLVLPSSSYPKPIVYETPGSSDPLTVEVVRPVRPFGLRVRIRLRRMRRAGVRALWDLVPPARWFSPVRLMIMVVLFVVAGTVWMTIHWNRRGTLTSDIVAMRAAWTRDIDAGDFGQARTKLVEAAATIRRYSGDTRDAREVQQLAEEVSHIADLLDRSFEDILRDTRTMSNTEVELYFRERLKNPALIVDTFVGPTPASGPGPAGYRVDSTIVIGQEKVRIDVSNLNLFTTLAPATATRVLFAARIQTIEQGPNPLEWTVRLVPDSGVLFTSSQCVEKLGWPMDDFTRALLESQTKWVLGEP
jgi:hypothetical protein